jgi:hypothetical protein
MMTWSVNWDIGRNIDGVSYQWEFRDRYAPLIHGKDDGIGDEDRPSAPTRLASPSQTETSIVSEVERFMEVYNKAWERNWGFVPLTENELGLR